MNREKIIEVNNTINFIYSLKEKMTQKIID